MASVFSHFSLIRGDVKWWNFIVSWSGFEYFMLCMGWEAISINLACKYGSFVYHLNVLRIENRIWLTAPQTGFLHFIGQENRLLELTKKRSWDRPWVTARCEVSSVTGYQKSFTMTPQPTDIRHAHPALSTLEFNQLIWFAFSEHVRSVSSNQ